MAKFTKDSCLSIDFRRGMIRNLPFRKTRTIPFFLTFFVLTSFFCVAALGDEPLPERGICSHRGANRLFPENTIPALEEAVRLGAAMIEFDVRFTKDRRLVLLHDWTVDRTSNGKGKILDLTFDEVRKLDFGGWMGDSFAGTTIPTLDEALAVFPRNIWLNIHIGGAPKEIEAEIGLAAADKIVADGRERQAFIACSGRMADAILAKYPQFLICNMGRQNDIDAYINNTIRRNASFIQLSGNHPTPEQIRRLKDAGVRINYFGTNDKEEIRKLLDLGVDFPLVDDLLLGQKIFADWKARHRETVREFGDGADKIPEQNGILGLQIPPGVIDSRG